MSSLNHLHILLIRIKDKGPNWTSTSVLDSKRTEVDKDRSG